MIGFTGRIVTIVGRLDALPNRLAAAAIERQGGIVRRDLRKRTAFLVVGHQALAQLASGRLYDKLDRADQLGATCLSENTLLRALALLPARPDVAGAVTLDELAAQTGLDPMTVRLLVLFDVLQPQDGRCSFRDLVAAREIARLLADGLGLVRIIAGALEAGGGRSPDDHPLARVKLVSDEGGRLARRIGEEVAELDGQLRLALRNPGNPSVDELFEAAEDAEQAGELARAEELYRRCVAVDRTDPIAPFNLANVLREQGRHGEAKSFLQLAVAIDPAFADAWYNLALLLDAERHKDAARACLERAIAADPDFADPLYALAQLHFEAGELAAAGRLWQRYLILDPDSEWSRLARHGLALCRQGQQEDGEAARAPRQTDPHQIAR